MADKHKLIAVWDFDGTLAFREGGFSGALVKCALREFPNLGPISIEQVRPFLSAGFPWHAPEILHCNQTVDDWWDNLIPVFTRALKNAGVPAQEAMKAAAGVREEYLDAYAWQLFTDSVTALITVHEMGFEQVILSNHVPELPLILDRLGLSSYFTARFNSGETGIEKPNLKAFRQVLDWAGQIAVPVMIGDNFKSDIVGAEEAGMAGILVRTRHPDARLHCESLNQLPTVIKSIAF
jgi:putative hydrolase of the HAD superfamily